MEQFRPARLVNLDRRTILCPRCERTQQMRDFATLGMNPRYACALTTVYRCKLCNHLFAPRPVPFPQPPEASGSSNGNNPGG